jgi:hypothetical protein
MANRSEKDMCLKSHGGLPGRQDAAACKVQCGQDRSINSEVRRITGGTPVNPLKAAKGGRK